MDIVLLLTRFTLANVGSLSVPAPSLEADPWILKTLVHIDAGQAGVGEGEAVVALALERAVHVDATTVRAHAGLKKAIQISDFLYTLKYFIKHSDHPKIKIC
jgi:hypothetical protein